MEIPETVSVRKFREFSARQKNQLYETLLELTDTIEELPKKSLRKTLELTLAVLEYKGNEVVQLQEKFEQIATVPDAHNSKGERRLNDENEKLKRMLQKIEDERDGFKRKTQELTDEILQLQKRLQEVAQQAEASDKDSSDPLSELDKHEQLLLNIDTKNKHIKRLLREIEILRDQNIIQSKTIVKHEQELQNINSNLVQLSDDITRVEQQRKVLKQREREQSLEITRLEGNITFLEDEREKQELEMRQFIENFEEKALNWKQQLTEKEAELNRIRSFHQSTTPNVINNNNNNSNTDSTNSEEDLEAEETTLRHLLEKREQYIESLESKINTMTEEIVNSTKAMNQLYAERERAKDSKQPRACCKMIEESLHIANSRIHQLSELLESAEQDNLLKSKQALHSINALEAYKRGEDGLLPALRKCSALEQKLSERDKQLRSYVQELNSMHEVVQENAVLRRRLKIPDDVVVLDKNLRAKERNKEKQIERLALKLRTSEELRLQLKLDKSELRRRLMELQQHQQGHPKVLDDPPMMRIVHVRQPSELGEIPSSAPEESSSPIIGGGGGGVLSRGQADGAATSELQTKYEEVLAENETLRFGMYEILEKLREYDGSSEHITIDSELLKRLIDVLPNRESSPAHLQNELLELKAREEALRQLLQQNASESETGEMSSVQSMGGVPEMPREFEVNPPHQPSNEIVDTATRPTTPNEAVNVLQLPVITREEMVGVIDGDDSPQVRDLQLQVAELSIYRKHFEELKLHTAADSNSLKQFNQQLHDQVAYLEVQLQQQSKSYAYMRVDYDRLLNEAKQQRLVFIKDNADLSRQLEQSKMDLAGASAELKQLHQGSIYSAEEIQQLERRNMELNTQLAVLMDKVFGNNVEGIKLPADVSVDYGIIDDNYQLDYVTAIEYEQQRAELSRWREMQGELQRKNSQLEGLLEVANGQIHSQQKLLNEITDNHINLRHLVADLQSSSEENLQIAKMQRDLDVAKSELASVESERQDLKLNMVSLQLQLQQAERQATQTEQDYQMERRCRDIKHKFLQRSLCVLREKYAKFTPLIFLTNFVRAYKQFTDRLEEQRDNKPFSSTQLQQVEDTTRFHLMQLAPNAEESQLVIKLIKAETQLKLLDQNWQNLQDKYIDLQKELAEQRLRQATESEHWQTIDALFSHPQPTPSGGGGKGQGQDVGTNTETPVPALRKTPTPAIAAQLIDKQTSPIPSPSRRTEDTNVQPPMTQSSMHRPALTESAVQTNGIHMHLQCHQSVQTTQSEIRSESSVELQEMQLALQDADKRIDELEKLVAKSNSSLNTSGATEASVESRQSGVVEKTILSFHSLLLEKDKSIQKFQDLLQSERDQGQELLNKQNAEIETLKATVSHLNFNIKTKDGEILELKAKIVMHSTGKITAKPSKETEHSDEGGGDNSLNELTDEKIEEMFEDSSSSASDRQEVATAGAEGATEKQDTEELKELPTLHKQIKELKDKLSFCEQTLKTREEEIEILREKLKLCQEREKSIETATNPEVEQLRGFLEEKDNHIRDLMETLKNFHDDQQRYINDTSNYSADQIAKLAADLNRTEATNKIYHTQMEALRRQVSNLTNREKQARELSQSLRNQLIKRPVVSIKTELNARVKSENLQKRIQQLEAEAEDARAQIQRQQTLLDAKRTRSANEVGLWEKQKRWQQSAEKFKAKLEETELALEKTRTLLTAARTTIARLEKDKHLLEAKLGRGVQMGATSNNLKCCRTPSCPNLQHVGSKFTPSPSESPETYTTGQSSECSSPAHHAQPNNGHHFFDQNQIDLIEALKSRIEMQQRKIIAMELEGRGSNALTVELEKLQERCQAAEAQNIRLEARNLQLQLDSDLLRQGDSTERLQKRIKHLEDYILALKEEMARAESRRDLCKCSGIKVNTQQGQSAEHTILSLRNLVEKLRSENKFLKDGRRSTDSRSSGESSTSTSSLELKRLQQLHAEAMEKINLMQQELSQRITKCSQCNGRSKDAANEELKFIKEQLTKKTQLLQKAKVLLTRAAAKEKVLKEQVAMWKRKCSELQNVPVIDEISE